MSDFYHAKGDHIVMAGGSQILALEGMDLDSLKKVREEATRKIKNERMKLRFKVNVEIPAEYRGHFELAAKWAYDHKLIKTRSRWAFCKFAITNSIDFIMGQIEKEELAKVQAAAAIPSQMVSGAQQPAQNTPDTTKTA